MHKYRHIAMCVNYFVKVMTTLRTRHTLRPYTYITGIYYYLKLYYISNRFVIICI